MNYQAFRNAQAQFNQRMAAVDPNWHLYGGIAGGAMGLTAANSMLDLILGPTNAFNSGEIPLNTLLTLAPVLGAYAGGAGGLLTYDKDAAMKAAAAQYDKDMKGAKDNLKGRTYKDADERNKAQAEFADRRNAAARRRDGTNEAVPGMGDVTYGQLRRARRGTAIGAGVAAVPAILSMLDRGE